MSKLLRWGLLSTARINRAILTAMPHSPRNVVTAVASRSAAQAAAYATEWKIPRTFASYEAMLADPDVDVIYNSLPNALHTEWTLKAIQAGKHVLCEKPLALTVTDVDAIAAAAQQAGVVVAEAFMYRHHPQTLRVAEMIAQGAVGQPRLLRGAFSYLLTNRQDVRLRPELGGGCLWDVGCYPISFTRFLARAEPVEVFGWQVSGPSGVDELFTGQLRFASGLLAQVDSAFRLPFRAFMEIAGSERTLTVPAPFKPQTDEEVILRHKNDLVEIIKIAGEPLYRGEIEDMADAVLLGKPPRVSLVESRGNVAVITALLESARINRPVAV